MIERMTWDWRGAILGALIGFGLGVFTCVGLAIVGQELSLGGRWALDLGIAFDGGLLGVWLRQPAGRGGRIARWSLGSASVVGGVGVLAGFVGPLVWRPDSSLGPLLGIFVTGPFGFLAGAILGAFTGMVVGRVPSRS